eukprot:1330733-Amorphochlora_amoeboformis.AAC.1
MVEKWRSGLPTIPSGPRKSLCSAISSAVQSPGSGDSSCRGPVRDLFFRKGDLKEEVNALEPRGLMRRFSFIETGSCRESIV